MDSAAAKFPPLKWAQNQERVLITIDLADTEDVEVSVVEDTQTLKFSCNVGTSKYVIDMAVFEPIVEKGSAWNVKGRNVIINLEKKDKDQTEEWWNRLTKDKVRNQLISIDWSKWKEPDDEEEDAGKGQPGAGQGGGGGMGDFDPSQMQNMMGGMGGGGMPGMGGMGGMPGMGGMGGMPGMGGMGGMPGMGGGGGGMPDMAALQSMMGGMGGGMPGMGGMGGMPGMGGMGGMGGDDSDDEEGEESHVEPHAKDGDTKPSASESTAAGTEAKSSNLDDLDGDEATDLKK